MGKSSKSSPIDEEQAGLLGQAEESKSDNADGYPEEVNAHIPTGVDQQYPVNWSFVRRFTRLRRRTSGAPGSTTCVVKLAILFVCYEITQLATVYTGSLAMEAIVNRDSVFWTLLAITAVTLVALSFIFASVMYNAGVLALLWRNRLTEIMQSLYLREGTFYRLLKIERTMDNVDQRITSDCDAFCTHALTFLGSACLHILTVLVFTFFVGWYFGWVGVVVSYGYFVVSSSVNLLVMKPIGRVVYKQAFLEGEYRTFHQRIIQNAESISFFNGYSMERAKSADIFSAIMHNVRQLLQKQKVLNTVSNLFMNLSVLVPFIITAVVIQHSSETDKGKLTQTAQLIAGSIGVLLTALNGLMEDLLDLPQLSGLAGRLDVLFEGLDKEESRHSGNVTFREMQDVLKSKIYFESRNVEVENLCYETPKGQSLGKNVSFSVDNQSYLIAGPSGCGKSALLRCLAGLWLPTSGRICFPKEGVFFLAQHAYVFPSTLRALISYPLEDSSRMISDVEAISIMDLLGLSYIVTRFGGVNKVVSWQDVLSGGEMQRMSWARLFFHKPRIAIVDEATSALAVDQERNLYSEARRRNIIMISVAHRPSVGKYHDKVLALNKYGHGVVMEADQWMESLHDTITE